MAIQMWIESGRKFSLSDLKDELPNSQAVKQVAGMENELRQMHEELERLRVLRSSLLGEAAVVLGQLLTWVDESDAASDYTSSCPLGEIVNQARQWERVYERSKRLLADRKEPDGLKQACEMIDHMARLKAEYTLRDFPIDGIDVDNLRNNRITRIAMNEAAKRCDLSLGMDDSRRLADELNDMIEASKRLSHSYTDA